MLMPPPKIETVLSSPELTIIKSEAIIETKTRSTLYLFPFILHNLLNAEVEGIASKLVSTDITVNCGELVTENLKRFWTLETLSGNIKKQFIDVVKKHREIELFIHDSNHTAKWEMFELLTVLKYCENLRFIIVDDVQANVIHKLIDLEWNTLLLRDGDKKSLLAIKN